MNKSQAKAINHPTRNRLPPTRPSITTKRDVCGYECYFTVSFFDDHTDDRSKPAEVFVKVAKHGSIISGLLDGFCTILSIALQYGIPWPTLRAKLEHHQFERRDDPEHTSLLDGVAKAVDHLIIERQGIIGVDPPRPAHVQHDTGHSDDSPQDVSAHATTNETGVGEETPKTIPRALDLPDQSRLSLEQTAAMLPRVVQNKMTRLKYDLGSQSLWAFRDIMPKHGLYGGPLVRIDEPKTAGDYSGLCWQEHAVYEDGTKFRRECVTVGHKKFVTTFLIHPNLRNGNVNMDE